jgi:hypothetical protein
MAARGAMLLIAATLTLVSSTRIATAANRAGLVVRADLIVVGTLRPMLSYPWSDGIRIGGTITVKEALYGHSPGSRLEFRDVARCSWTGLGYCDIRMWLANPRIFPDEYRQLGIWFLTQASDGTWRPSMMAGFDTLSRRAEYEGYIRDYKH